MLLSGVHRLCNAHSTPIMSPAGLVSPDTVLISVVVDTISVVVSKVPARNIRGKRQEVLQDVSTSIKTSATAVASLLP